MFHNIVTKSGAMQSGQKCLLCEKHAVMRCVNCGPVVFYCEGCFSDLHKYVNTLHVAEKWEVSYCAYV